ncbi:MAG: HAMP domain-containing histidine kinase, partial [Anaerolineae bacterium]|nr:HAMP domain-containing histidine kinase [Anaerolineae bacterium]
LSVITVALLLLLVALPAPFGPTYERLATIGRELLTEFTSGEIRLQAASLLNTRERLLTFAQENEVRLLLITNLSGNDGTVALDTGEAFQRGDPLQIQIDTSTYQLPPFLQRLLTTRTQSLLGRFADPDHAPWLFVGLEVTRQNNITNAILVADRTPTHTFQQVVSQFQNSLALPLLEAALVGLAAAVILAAFISRNIARSLQHLGQAAVAVMNGDYEHRVPVSGAPEVRAVGEAFNAMSARTQANQQAQQDFVANVSHDLKTPLTSIQGYSQAIMDGTAKDPAHAAAIIFEESSRLNRMVIELTDLARLQAGRLSLQSVPVDMAQISTAIGQRLAIVAEKKGVTLHVDTQPVPEVIGDGDRLVQVLTNLVSNALKYTSTGGKVWVKTHINNGGVEVIVQDNGVGIPPEDLPRIFERFYQVDKTRGPRRGTGLGLSITYEIIKAHDGRITVTSGGKDQGATFTVWLPSPHLNTIAR